MGRGKEAFCRSRPGNEDRQKAWHCMRLRVRFTLSDLEVIAAIGYTNAKRYVRMLERAGYLRRVARSNGRPGVCAAWVLIRNSGPKAPILRTTDPPQVYDPNTDEVFSAGRGPAGGEPA